MKFDGSGAARALVGFVGALPGAQDVARHVTAGLEEVSCRLGSDRSARQAISTEIYRNAYRPTGLGTLLDVLFGCVF